MNTQPRHQVSIIIVSYNVVHFLELCLDSVMRAIERVNAEVIVVDNVSVDGSCELVEQKFPSVRLLRNTTNLGFSKANNQGIAISSAHYIHFLNPDTIVSEDFYHKTLAYLDRNPQVGALGPRLIDGRGQYAPDSKKSFPGFWTSVYKVTGLAKLFPLSTRFNKYYAASIGEHEISPTEILSGCCLLVRNDTIKEIGGGFDESYFMYCEDVDLCHRINLAGYTNVYYPETTVLHYKGESTRKLSYKYMKVFYTAHALFVKKYYPRRLGNIYIVALKIVLGIRNFFNWGRHLFSLFKLSLLDVVLLVATLLLVGNVWFDYIAEMPLENNSALIKTAPIFVVIWLVSLYLNGAYDKPFSLLKAMRGMLFGSIIVLAGYALLPVDLRYSRAVIVITAIVGSIFILLARLLLAKFKLIKLVPRGKVDYSAVIVADRSNFTTTKALLKNVQYNLDIIGRIEPQDQVTEGCLCVLDDLPTIQKTYEINEIIYHTKGIAYRKILENMQACAPGPFYKIHIGSAVVGSNTQRNPAEEFQLSSHYVLAGTQAKRNKRILDFLASFLFLVAYPFVRKKLIAPKGFLNNIKAVILGELTWIGYPQTYCKSRQLPKIRPAVSWPFRMQEDKEVKEVHRIQIAEIYASNYSVWDDIRLLGINFKFLGGKV